MEWACRAPYRTRLQAGRWRRAERAGGLGGWRRPQRPQAGAALLHSEPAPGSGGRPAPRTHPLHQPSGAQAGAPVPIRVGSAPKLTPRVASGSDGAPACKGGQGCLPGGHRLPARLAKGRGTLGLKFPLLLWLRGQCPRTHPSPRARTLHLPWLPLLGAQWRESWRMSSVPVTRAESPH